MQKLVPMKGHRWAIEDSSETAKNEFGLDHHESRSRATAGIAMSRWSSP
jgi:SRSO17 transposase